MLTLLERGLVMVHLDARLPSVQVPEHLKDQTGLRLNIAYGFNLPSLEIDTDGIYAVLSFNRQSFACDLPWEAVFALTVPSEGYWGVMWPLSVPEEHRDELVGGDVPMTWTSVIFGATAPESLGRDRTGHLKVVTDEEEASDAMPAPEVAPAEDAPAGEGDTDAPPLGRGRPALRLVKG
jgi:stringent starvation protein B